MSKFYSNKIEKFLNSKLLYITFIVFILLSINLDITKEVYKSNNFASIYSIIFREKLVIYYVIPLFLVNMITNYVGIKNSIVIIRFYDMKTIFKEILNLNTSFIILFTIILNLAAFIIIMFKGVFTLDLIIIQIYVIVIQFLMLSFI